MQILDIDAKTGRQIYRDMTAAEQAEYSARQDQAAQDAVAKQQYETARAQAKQAVGGTLTQRVTPLVGKAYGSLTTQQQLDVLTRVVMILAPSLHLFDASGNVLPLDQWTT